MSEQVERPSAAAVFKKLKDFQRDTANYAFRRLYTDSDATRRFLVADEVGLGKTLVARGVIARAIEHLWDDIDRIDILYICSNADIARQNVNRLNVTQRDEFALASRITLLPKVLQGLKSRKLNFISFTPGTSLDPKSSLGTVEERALIHWLLDRAWGLGRSVAPLKVLRGTAALDRFRWKVRETKKWKQEDIDYSLAEGFISDLEEHDRRASAEGRPGLAERFADLCDRFRWTREDGRLSWADREDRRELVRELRAILAASCVTALEPDLVILDEFQRFRYLLCGDDDASRLAQELFNYEDKIAKSRVLLLSATPYKMYTLAHEADGGNHYEDFITTLGFLYDDESRTAEVAELLQRYRRDLFRLATGGDERLHELRRDLELKLRRVMVRTERLAVSEDRSGMLKQVPIEGLELHPRDLDSYLAFQRVARCLGQPDTLEYWKSAPYLLNFMDAYSVKHAFRKALNVPAKRRKLAAEIPQGDGSLLSWDDVERYADIDPRNARLRALMADMVGGGAWRLLWIPPTLRYHQLGGPFADPAVAGITKRLVFSGWQVVPRVIAMMMSFAAEGHMFRLLDDNPKNTAKARARRTQLLRFSYRDGRLTAMPVLGLIYGSTTLARRFDPLTAAHQSEQDGLLTLSELVGAVRNGVDELLAALQPAGPTDGPEDEAWYWAAPILLDLQHDPVATREWFANPDLAAQWAAGDTPAGGEEHTRWADHVEYARQLLDGSVSLGRRPADLSLVLAQQAVAGPGTVALRALTRVAGGGKNVTDPAVRRAAARVAWSFRSLFNVPEVIALLRGLGRTEPYWRRVLEYCAEGGLQAMLDEYAHMLVESLGVSEQEPVERAEAVAEQMQIAMTIRAGHPKVDEIVVDPATGELSLARRAMRTRFAVRLGEERTEDGRELRRADHVRAAFNSPFWPFVLASTSIGQEGLDFHPYCHAVVHWNLPSNPVDLEQREGRVHRYKGHAVRKNLAARYGESVLAEGVGDPWEALFKAGQRDRLPDDTDLVPFWVYPLEGGATIERHVPALPLSRDRARLEQLRRSLAVYRMAFGQPSQEDLVAYLLTQLPQDEVDAAIDGLQIDLSPLREMGDESRAVPS